MVDKKAIGRRIQEYRKKSGLTQEELAEKIGLSASYYSAIERGASFPRFDNLIAIINGIGASADQIFVDVIDNTSQTRASKLAEEMEGLPTKEQRRILNVVETMVRDVKEMQDA